LYITQIEIFEKKCMLYVHVTSAPKTVQWSRNNINGKKYSSYNL
jgi:hypothetical protein